MDDVPSTLPTPLMPKLVGAPPDKLHASVEELPETIELGVAVKELITGATTGCVTVTVTDELTLPALFEAVSV